MSDWKLIFSNIDERRCGASVFFEGGQLCRAIACSDLFISSFTCETVLANKATDWLIGSAILASSKMSRLTGT